MEKFVNQIGAYLLKKGAIRQDDLEVFAYGLDVLLFSALSALGALALGLLIGRFVEMVFCMLAFAVLQATGGGYHANTHLMCFLTTVCGAMVSAALCGVLPVWGAFLCMLLGIIAVFGYAPVEHADAPMSAEKKIRARRSARIACLGLAAAACAVYAWRPVLATAIAVGIGMSGVSKHAARSLSGK